jgi:CRP-like cAMP-binding protein
MTFALPIAFDLAEFLASAGLGRRIVELKPKQTFFSQGDSADSVFYLQKGRAKITVVSTAGKEATVTLLVPHEFVGEEALSGVPGLRLSTATAITACSALKIGREEMIRVMHQERKRPEFPTGMSLAWRTTMPSWVKSRKLGLVVGLAVGERCRRNGGLRS